MMGKIGIVVVVYDKDCVKVEFYEERAGKLCYLSYILNAKCDNKN